MLEIQTFVFSPFQVNTYLIIDKATRAAAIIDPGCSNESEEKRLSESLRNSNVNLKYVINTHLHIDHIFGNAFLTENYEAKLIYPRGDEFLLPIMYDEAKRYGVELKRSPQADLFFEDLNELQLGETKLQLLFTPGHTPGEYSLYSQQDNVCFTGDVLFFESVGRTDLWEGDFDVLLDSIYNRLFVLPDETVVLSGHGKQTTIGYEKNYNPFL